MRLRTVRPARTCLITEGRYACARYPERRHTKLQLRSETNVKASGRPALAAPLAWVVYIDVTLHSHLSGSESDVHSLSMRAVTEIHIRRNAPCGVGVRRGYHRPPRAPAVYMASERPRAVGRLHYQSPRPFRNLVPPFFLSSASDAIARFRPFPLTRWRRRLSSAVMNHRPTADPESRSPGARCTVKRIPFFASKLVAATRMVVRLPYGALKNCRGQRLE